jgi:pimeloyl-ACP methyl ester carboxylesterase
MVFFSGFPDTYNSFDEMVPGFEKTHHIVKCIMPGFDKRRLPFKYTLGYPFETIVDSLCLVIKPYLDNGSEVTICAHDWGSYIVQRFVNKYPTMPSKVILLDVGLDDMKGKSASDLFFTFAYRFWLAFAFLPSIFLDFIGVFMLAIFPWRYIGPTPKEYNMPRPPLEIKGFMTYPYFQLFVSIFTCDANLAPTFVDTVPTLFVYGKRKRVMFHGKNFLADLDATEGCEHHCFTCGHWIQTQKPNELVTVIKEWEQRLQTKASGARS